MSKKKTTKKQSTKKKVTVAKANGEAAKPAASGKSRASAKPDKPRRTSALDAAATVLKKSGKPMRSQELITAMASQGLWSSPNGKTPHATLYAAMVREINEKGGEARFKKVDRGQFTCAG
jgi:hypothetical protein